MYASRTVIWNRLTTSTKSLSTCVFTLRPSEIPMLVKTDQLNRDVYMSIVKQYIYCSIASSFVWLAKENLFLSAFRCEMLKIVARAFSNFRPLRPWSRFYGCMHYVGNRTRHTMLHINCLIIESQRICELYSPYATVVLHFPIYT